MPVLSLPCIMPTSGGPSTWRNLAAGALRTAGVKNIAAGLRRNAGALAFWRWAAQSYPGVRNIIEEDRRDAQWDGAVLRFRVG